MRIQNSVFLILLLANICASQSVLAIKKAETDKTLQSIHKKQQNVGLSAAIFHRGKLVYSDGIGYANLEYKIPVMRDTKFQVASVTKAFTGAALIKLHEDGKIDLNADIRKYIPNYPQKGITPNLLAAHLAGIRHYKQGEKTAQFLSNNYSDLNEAIKIFKEDDLLSEPGTKYQYTSFGYNLLALTIQNAAKKRFDKYIQDEIIDSLDLRNTRFNDVRFVIGKRSSHYSFFDPLTFKPSKEILRVPDFDYSYNMGGGNIITTSEDLAKFGQVFTMKGLFSVKALEMFYRRQDEKSPWSYGWFVPKEPEKTGKRLHITGAFPGVQASLYVYPDDGLSIAIISNTWGIGSNSGEMVSTVPEKIAEIWLD
ncbi:MAG: beta-lactamase family protein [Pyrinomonadaceae bacterium]|nr:beta-lactamase family protein [Pyrinomonadaceae bacterium]